MIRRITNAMRIDTIKEFYLKNSQIVPDMKKKNYKTIRRNNKNT